MPPFLSQREKRGLKSTAPPPPPRRSCIAHDVVKGRLVTSPRSFVVEETRDRKERRRRHGENGGRGGYQCGFSGRSGYARRINCALHPRRGKNPMESLGRPSPSTLKAFPPTQLSKKKVPYCLDSLISK